ncbi:rhodanese-like domain-containing protein [Parvibaculum sp.]|jgi:rhodanese-related sulfurtransferase|uniref:rhodanese-like domain-containing protein n=1 Tax=Parvibaculum sp. TaxID=2024848 RepID=UPI00329965CE
MSGKSENDQGPAIIGDRPDNYAGDVTPEEAWRVLSARSDAVLVDVRTRAEWSFVGVPDLSGAGKEPVLVEWQQFPTMAQNAGFAADLVALLGAARREAPVFFLCRSGARSKAAAIAMSQSGFASCFNIDGGFEGDLDAARHRGGRNGWKAANLPWVQG